MSEIRLNQCVSIISATKLILFESRHSNSCLDKFNRDVSQWEILELFNHLKADHKLELNFSPIGNVALSDLKNLNEYIKKPEFNSAKFTHGRDRETLDSDTIKDELERRRLERNDRATDNRAREIFLKTGKTHKSIKVPLTGREFADVCQKIKQYGTESQWLIAIRDNKIKPKNQHTLLCGYNVGDSFMEFMRGLSLDNQSIIKNSGFLEKSLIEKLIAVTNETLILE